MNSNTKVNLLGISAVAMWGSLGLLGKFSQAMRPEFVLTVCFAIAACIGILVCRITKRAIVFGSINKLIIFVVLLCAYHLLYLVSFKFAPALLILIGNLFFSLGSGFLGFAGVVLGFIGIAVLLVGDQAVIFDRRSIIGYVLAFVGALFWAIFSNLRRKDNADSIVSMTIICFFSAVVCALLMFATNSIPKAIASTEMLIVLLLAIGPAGGAFFLWDIGLKRGNAAFLAVSGYSAPLISTVLMIFFGFAKIHWTVIYSALLIAIGGVLVSMNRKGRVRA